MQITYEIHYSRRRSISVSITSDCRIFVKAPIGTTESAIRDFLTTKKTWITKHLEKQQSESEKAKALGYLSAEEIKQIKKKAHKIIPERVEYYRHMNHSKAFYEEIDKYFPDYKRCNKWLKENGGIYFVRVENDD